TTQNLTGATGVSMAIGQNSVSIGEEDPNPAFNFTNAACTIEGSGPTGNLDTNSRTISSITIQPDLVTTCTFTNAKQPAHITVTKVMVNDNGGTSVVPDFTLKVGDQVVTSGITATIAEGTSAITESGPSGYTASFSGGCDPNGNITMKAG